MTIRNPLALSSRDGRSLSDGSSVDWRPNPDLTKIVIGKLRPEKDDAAIRADLPPDLAILFPNLTHLHVWSVADLHQLPKLPGGLRCLDIRGCAELKTLPELAPELETLDLGGCAGLDSLPRNAPAALRYFFFNDCAALDADDLTVFLRSLATPEILELDGSRCDAVRSLKHFPLSLRKLVLSGCAKLTDVRRVAGMTMLDHLDLSMCASLEELPDLPASVRYVTLHGSDNLKRFRDQDIGPYDRGVEEKQNVARTLHSRRKFGEKLAASAHAKLLLMGDGRVGKTTLAKRLQWETFTAGEQAARPEMRPSLKEDPTHKLHFWRWEAPLSLPPQRLEDLRSRADARKVQLPVNSSGELTGAVRIWDFGGEEIYHNTHRIFAGEGSVFLVVWREAEPDWAAIEKERPQGCDADEWREWNRQRPLDYWLDYIFSIRGDARVALVCTACPRGSRRPDWHSRAGRHSETERGRKIPCFYLDSLDTDCATNPDYLNLVDWLKEQCGNEADRIGVLQPAFFGNVANQFGAMLEANVAARASEEQAPNLIVSWKDWSGRLIDHHRQSQGGAGMDENDVHTITGYLHDAGQLFVIRRGGEAAVLVDQQWATGLIYEMLRPGGRLFSRIVRNGGWFALSDLEHEPEWRELESALQRELLLQYMETSHVIVPVEARRDGDAERIFVANEKWLLPDDAKIQDRLDADMEIVRRTPGMDQAERFSISEGDVSEFDFRDLMAYLGRGFGRYATWFRRGMQAMPRDQRQPDWCFRLRWRENEKAAFYGKVDAVLVTRREWIAPLSRQVEELFEGEASPLARLGKPSRVQAEAHDLTRAFFSSILRPGEEEVGISSSGADAEEAAALVNALRAAGINALWYRLLECRSGEYAKVQTFMDARLGKAPCMVVLLSDAYLRDDPEHNWYCPYEFADVILQWERGRRAIHRTFVVYKSGQTLTSQNLDIAIAGLFERFAEHFGQRYAEVPVRQRINFRWYDEIASHFSHAWQDGRIGRFFAERGTLGSYSEIAVRDGTRDFTPFIRDIQNALK